MALLSQINYIPPIFHILYGLALVVFFYAIATFPSSFFVNKYSMYLGKISYSVYLSHFFVVEMSYRYIFQILRIIIPNEILYFVLFYTIILIISIIVSTITFNLIEKPFIDLGKKLVVKIG